MKRDATQTIWRTVVFAGAMLGAPACSKKHPATTPTNTVPATQQTPTTDTAAKPDTNAPPAGDPCAGQAQRPRGTDDDGGGGVGRGFVLS